MIKSHITRNKSQDIAYQPNNWLVSRIALTILGFVLIFYPNRLEEIPIIPPRWHPGLYRFITAHPGVNCTIIWLVSTKWSIPVT